MDEMLMESNYDCLEFNVDDIDFSVFDFLGEEFETLTAKLNQNKIRTKVAKASKVVHSKKVSPYRKGMTVRQALAEGAKKPNMSRRSPTSVLIAFPVFDRCDSLVYFPSTLARLANSDDVNGTRKLISAHVHKDCTFMFHINTGNVLVFNQNSFIQLLEISNLLEPDRIMCVHSTKVVENHIRATLYMKLTDNQHLYELISQTTTVKDPNVAAMCLVDRSARLKYYIHDELLAEPVKREIVAHADSTEDLLLYIQCDIVLTIDDMTKKITSFEMTYLITSLHPVSSISHSSN